MMSNPENLPKARLIEELRKRGVHYSPAKSKDYYVSLYKQHFARRSVRHSKRSEFSSDDDAIARSLDKSPSRGKRYTKVLDVDHFMRQLKPISDSELMRQLRTHGIDAGPITSTTRGLYEKKLAKVMAEKAKGGVSTSSSAVTIASESDEEEDLSSGGEEVDTVQPPPKPQIVRQVRQSSTVVKRVSTRGSPRVESSYQLRSTKPRPLPVKQQPVIETQEDEYDDDDGDDVAIAEPRPQSDSSGFWWVWLQLVLLLVAFVVGLIVFDYIRYGNSRVVAWINTTVIQPSLQ